MADVEHWIWLAQALGAGSARPLALAHALGGPKAVYEAGPAALAEAGCTPHELAALAPKELEGARRIVEHCLAKGYGIVTPDDAAYPAPLLETSAAPAVLYVAGRLPETDTLCIAMVGTRRVTEYGTAAAERLAMGLARAGAAVVSGLAAGVDACAHRGALKGGGRTYAVLGCGLDTVYPAQNRELYRLIAKNGALISEFAPREAPLPFHFPLRNRIIAGLCAGTVVVEAGLKSGSLITAAQALEMGRDVFAVPGSIFSPMSEGAHRLIKDGAKPACSVFDILEEYPSYAAQTLPVAEETPPLSLFDAPAAARAEPEHAAAAAPAPAAAPRRQPAAWGLTAPQRTVFALLSDAPCHVDELAGRAGLAPAQVLAVLTVLEIQGLARSEPGRRYRRVPQPGV